MIRAFVGPTPQTPLASQAARLWPDDAYLQSEWMRAVAVVRSTSKGWVCDQPEKPHV